MKITSILKLQFKVLAVVLMAFLVNSSNAYAFTDENNVTVNITSDKESYLKGEHIKLNIDVINNSQGDINDVNIKCIAPDNVKLFSNYINMGMIMKSKDSYAEILLRACKDEGKESTVTVDDGNNLNKNASTTADGTSKISFILLLSSVGIAAIVFKKNKKVLSCMVVGIVFCGVLNGTNASASEIVKTINLDKTILVDGQEITVSFKVSYKIKEDNNNFNDQSEPENPVLIEPGKPGVGTDTPGVATETPLSPSDSNCCERIVEYDVIDSEFNHKKVVVKSAQELKDTLKKFMKTNEEYAEYYNKDLLEEYSDKYFESNNLILYPHSRCNGDTSKAVNITIENNVISLNMICESYCSDDDTCVDLIQGYLLLGEVSKSEFNDETTVFINIKEITSYDPCMYKVISRKNWSDIDDDLNRKATIIKSLDELQKYNKLCNNKVSSQYNEEFFNNKSLIVLPIIEGSSCISHEIGQLVVYSESYSSNGKLQINLDTKSPDIVTCDMCEDFIVIEVDKHIVEDINEININEENKKINYNRLIKSRIKHKYLLLRSICLL